MNPNLHLAAGSNLQAACCVAASGAGCYRMFDKTEPIISPDLLGPARGPASLVNAVVQTNVRAAQELLRIDNPKGVLELQQRFLREYITALLQGMITIVDAVEATAKTRKFTGQYDDTVRDPLIIILEA
jgi:hypothetical protein